MSFKADRYTSSKDMDEDMESLTERLAQDLRRHIRQLSNSPVLSDSWLECADTFGRIANISDMESRLSADKNPKGTATLWETDEQALRFLLEDGKLNFSLRSMVEYKDKQRKSISGGKEGPLYIHRAECDKFEFGLGVVLRNAWSHIEALQTTDLTLLLNHIDDVLTFAIDNPREMREYCEEGNMHMRQEVMVFSYLVSVLGHMESMHEGSIMPLIRANRIFSKGVKFLTLVHRQFSTIHSLKIIEALSMIADSEDFKTYTSTYVANEGEGRELFELKGSVIASVCVTMDQKRAARALTDACDKAKRTYRL